MQAAEMQLEKTYIECHDGGYWMAGGRVSLDSIGYAWRRKQSPESIQRSFPVLRLAQVLGSLAYYLDHQAEIDEYLLKTEEEEKVIAERIRATYPELHERLDKITAAIREVNYEDQVSSRQ